MMEIMFFFGSMILVSLFLFDWWSSLNLLSFSFFVLSLKGIFSELPCFCLSYSFGFDWISLVLVQLTVWISVLSILASFSLWKSSNMQEFLVNILVLNFILLLTFSSIKWMYFFVMFEASIIPTLFIIIGWGNKTERVQSGMYLFFYMVVASVPLLVSLVKMKMTMYSSVQFFINNYFSSFLIFWMVFAFLVKMPMFMVHSWLPKAHVEAPVAGSMILAGILLKLGGFGIIRLFSMISSFSFKFLNFFIVFSLLGGMISSLICLQQTDMKSLIAFSSVSHMSIVIASLFTLNMWGLICSVSMMVAHGLCSSGLFMLANINYERSHTRSLYFNKGSLNVLPTVSMWWFMLSACNLGAPPSLNLWSEIGLISSVLTWSFTSCVILGALVFLSGAYSIYLFIFSQHGKLFSSMGILFSGFMVEYLGLMLHWIPLNFMMLFFKSFL